MSRPYYIYLTKEAWVGAWEKGGTVPINLASAYLSDVRRATMTPDEAFQQTNSGIPEWVLDQSNGPSPLIIEPGAGRVILKDVGFNWGDGKMAHVPYGEAASRFEDGLILSLSTRLDGEIAKGLEKVACVQIRCMACLIETLDAQIGTKCKWGAVRYRDGFTRNHFLKATADAWQCEYRLLWLTADVALHSVVLPPHMAKRVYW